MSEAVEAPVTETQTALAIIPASQLPTILAADGAKSILDALKAELDRFKPDVTTPKGKREIASKAYKVAVAKNDLIRLADTLKEDAQKVIKGVNAEVRVVEAEMDALRDAVRKPLDDFEAMEARREQGHRDAIVAIEAFAAIPENWPAGHIDTRIAELEELLSVPRDWQEFAAKALDAIGTTRRTLERAYQAAAVREAEAEETARQAAAAAEERRQAEERERLAREERIAAEAAQRAREAAERAAAEEAAEVERLAQAEREAAAQREQEAREAAERAEREKGEAEERARQAEAQREAERIERHRSAIRTIEAQDRFARPPTSAEVQARHDGLCEPFAWDFEEFAAEAEAARSAVMARLAPMYAAAKEREDEAIEAQRVAREAEQKRREEQAIEAERRRREQEEAKAKAEADRRAANKAHRTKINREALTAIMLAMADEHSVSAEEAEKIGIAIVTAIATGSVPHVRIEY
jgi:colicin import membrane protein